MTEKLIPDGELTKEERQHFVWSVIPEVMKGGIAEAKEFTRRWLDDFIKNDWGDKNEELLENNWWMKALQKALIKAKKLPEGADDGYFWPITLAALVNFQKEKGLLVDGIAWYNTQIALWMWEGIVSDDKTTERKPKRKWKVVDEEADYTCNLLSQNCRDFVSRLPERWQKVGKQFALMLLKQKRDIEGTPMVQLFDPTRNRGLIFIDGEPQEVPIIHKSGETIRWRLHKVTEMSIASAPSVDCSLTGSATVLWASFRSPTLGSKYIHWVDLRWKYNDKGNVRRQTEGCIGLDADYAFSLAKSLKPFAERAGAQKRDGKKNKNGFESEWGVVTYYNLKKPFYTYIA